MANANISQTQLVQEPPNQLKDMGTSVVNGVTIGTLEVFWWISMLALIFSGPLSGYLGRASIYLFAGMIISGGFVAYRNSWRGSVAIPQDVPVAILIVATSRMVVSAQGAVGNEALYITLVVTIGIASIATGLFMVLLGVFKWGNLVRFLPYPVMAGFLGGTGWLLFTGGLASSLESGSVADIFQAESTMFWYPTVILAFIVYFVGRKISRPIILPILLMIATGIFYAITLGMGFSVAELTDAGWLMGALPAGNQPQFPNLSEFNNVQWNLILGEAGSLVVLAVASSIAMLLNNSGFELAINADLDPNQDLRAHGIANILGGLVGGWPVYISPSWSSINAKDKKQHPLAGVVIPIAAGVLLFFATQLLAFMPRFIVGTTVAYMGVMFLIEWVWEPAKRLPTLEFGIVLLILGVIAFFGLLEGVAVGLVLAVILFVINYSQIDVLRHVMSGQQHRSRVTRIAEHQDYLRTVGNQIRILQLHGYIFFGSANRLLDKIRELVDSEPIKYLIIDFDRVTGIDSTALLSFSKMEQFLARQGVELYLCDLSADAQTLIKQELSLEIKEQIEIFDNVDLALQTAEDTQLIDYGFDPKTPVPSLREQIEKTLPEATNIQQLLDLLEVKALRDGEYLMKAGDPANDMFFVKDGLVTAQLEREDGKIIRLETMSMGRSVGELGFYLNQERTAAVVSQGNSIVYRLTKENLAYIERNHPEVASTIHRLIVNLLSDRVTHLVGVVNVLQQ